MDGHDDTIPVENGLAAVHPAHVTVRRVRQGFMPVQIAAGDHGQARGV